MWFQKRKLLKQIAWYLQQNKIIGYRKESLEVFGELCKKECITKVTVDDLKICYKMFRERTPSTHLFIESIKAIKSFFAYNYKMGYDCITGNCIRPEGIKVIHR